MANPFMGQSSEMVCIFGPTAYCGVINAKAQPAWGGLPPDRESRLQPVAVPAGGAAAEDGQRGRLGRLLGLYPRRVCREPIDPLLLDHLVDCLLDVGQQPALLRCHERDGDAVVADATGSAD